MEEAFEELRRLMRQSHLTHEQREQLWELIQQASACNPCSYQEQWVEYMRSFPQHFTKALTELESLEQLERACKLVPYGLFSLTLWDKGARQRERRSIYQSPRELFFLGLPDNRIGNGGAEALAKSSCLGRVASLNLRCNNIWEEGAEALAQSPNLGQLTLSQPGVQPHLE